MALSTVLITSYGVTATYAKAVVTSLNSPNMVKVEYYLSAEARLAGSPPLTGKDFIFPFTIAEDNIIEDIFTEAALELEGATPLRLAYAFLRTTDEFTGASDC